jgi:hypothetical protein|tara:strand:+ start:511 stop:2943 length:2433 start_codon:yes stop_codon:yes gene_type:complete
MTEKLGQIPTTFPSQAVSDSVKRSDTYGLSVARAIEEEWFNKDSSVGRYWRTRDEYHTLRLYARGEQSVRKYKDEFSINGDLSYLNLDWKPVPIVPKFVDIVVNGMQDRLFNIKAFAQDPIATGKRTKFVENVQRDLAAQEILAQIEAELGVNARNVPKEELPANTEELELFMQLNYKQGIEIAEEQAINNVFLTNNYHELKSRVDYDLATIGIGAVKNSFNNTDGIVLDWVDPANLIWSYTEDPNFQDCYYFGEVKRISLNELKKEFPDLNNEDIKELVDKGSNWTDVNQIGAWSVDSTSNLDSNNTLTVLYFNWKTWEHDVYKIKETTSGADKAIEKDDSFNPPQDQRSRFEKVKQSREILYEGVFVLGTNTLLKWKKAENMLRPNSNTNKVLMNYTVSAPRLYKGNITSLVSKMTPYADLIQLTHLKLQQAIQRMTPSGVYLDADGLSEVDLGNGTSYNPQEALNMYFQTGSIIGRSLTVEGDQNPGKIPIQELPGGGGGQIQVLIATYNNYVQMLRDVTGLNEARDGSDPDPKALVGVQKMAAANSNVATRHILQSSMYITTTIAECIALRIKDVLLFHPTKEAFIGALGKFSVGSLEELKNLNLHDFGIFLELEPDEDEKAMLEANIQTALAQGSIYLEDAIDVREINNIKLANQFLKFRRIKKQQADQAQAQAASTAQAEAQGQAQVVVEQAKSQAEQVKTESKIQYRQADIEFEIKKMEVEARTKRELMQYEYELNVKLKELELKAQKELMEKQNETAKDVASIKTSTKSLSGPPTSGKPIKSFESKGNDVLGGIDLSRFSPK